jgi:hypothetical protein
VARRPGEASRVRVAGGEGEPSGGEPETEEEWRKHARRLLISSSGLCGLGWLKA